MCPPEPPNVSTDPAQTLICIVRGVQTPFDSRLLYPFPSRRDNPLAPGRGETKPTGRLMTTKYVLFQVLLSVIRLTKKLFVQIDGELKIFR